MVDAQVNKGTPIIFIRFDAAGDGESADIIAWLIRAERFLGRKVRIPVAEPSLRVDKVLADKIPSLWLHGRVTNCCGRDCWRGIH